MAFNFFSAIIVFFVPTFSFSDVFLVTRPISYVIENETTAVGNRELGNLRAEEQEKFERQLNQLIKNANLKFVLPLNHRVHAEFTSTINGYISYIAFATPQTQQNLVENNDLTSAGFKTYRLSSTKLEMSMLAPDMVQMLEVASISHFPQSRFAFSLGEPGNDAALLAFGALVNKAERIYFRERLRSLHNSLGFNIHQPLPVELKLSFIGTNSTTVHEEVLIDPSDSKAQESFKHFFNLNQTVLVRWLGSVISAAQRAANKQIKKPVLDYTDPKDCIDTFL